MNYKETIDFLFSSLPVFQRIGKAAYKANLDNTLQLDKTLGFPHKKFKSIHIAGTNGKGSVSHILASVFQEAGYKTGLYTSPHLVDFRERIKVNASMIPESYVTSFVQKIKPEIEELQPSFFELTVAMAFDYFASEHIDIAIIETGMGGRLDSTNIIEPELSVITNISLDHTQFLGNTIEKIAKEKGGIIKAMRPLVHGKCLPEAKSTLHELARQRNAKVYQAAELRSFSYHTLDIEGYSHFFFKNNQTNQTEEWLCDLNGNYQSENIQTTLCALEAPELEQWNLHASHIYEGIKNAAKNTSLRGRWETLGANPRIICDTAHNEAGIRSIAQQLNQTSYKALHIVWGMVEDKDAAQVMKLLPRDANYYFCMPSIDRKMPLEMLISEAKKLGIIGTSYQTAAEALLAAKSAASPEDCIFIGGSTFVVSDILSENPKQ